VDELNLRWYILHNMSTKSGLFGGSTFIQPQSNLKALIGWKKATLFLNM